MALSGCVQWSAHIIPLFWLLTSYPILIVVMLQQFIQLLLVAIFSHILHRIPAEFEVWYLHDEERRSS